MSANAMLAKILGFGIVEPGYLMSECTCETFCVACGSILHFCEDNNVGVRYGPVGPFRTDRLCLRDCSW